MPEHLRKGRRPHTVSYSDAKTYMNSEIRSVSIVGLSCLLQKAVAYVYALDPSLRRTRISSMSCATTSQGG